MLTFSEKNEILIARKNSVEENKIEKYIEGIILKEA